MKRFLISVVGIFLIFSAAASAQTKFGVTAGVNFSTASIKNIDLKARAGWNAGVSCLVNLPLGFSLQPSLVYSQRGVNLADRVSQDMGYLELPVSIQWGPDLLILRPFVDITPYIGYAVTNRLQLDATLAQVSSTSWEGKQRFEYGLGIGGGVNVWKLQILARYCWNFGSLYNLQNTSVSDAVKDIFDELNTESSKFGGVTINVAFFF